MSSRSLRFSRWRRLPGAHRILERRLPTHAETPQRFTLYLPGRLIEDAEALARLTGSDHAQAYCEDVLSAHIRGEVERLKAEAEPPEPPEDEDVETLAGERAAARLATRGPLVLSLPEEPRAPERLMLPAPPAPESDAAASVLRHAGQAGPGGFLAALRRGEPPPAADVRELIDALRALSARERHTDTIARPLAHALFRIALESQVLLTDAWPHLADDARTLSSVREIQELAERALGCPLRNATGAEAPP